MPPNRENLAESVFDLSLRCLQRSAACLGECADGGVALERWLRDLGTLSHWTAAAFYEVSGSPDSLLRPKHWHSATAKLHQDFFTLFSEKTLAAPLPCFQADLTHAPQDLAAVQAGFRSRISFAIAHGGKTVAMTELLSPIPYTPNPVLLDSLRACGELLGAALAKQCLESRFNLINSVIEHAPSGFAFVDPDFRYLRINPALAKLNRKSAEEHIGRTIQEMIPHSWEKVRPFFEQVRDSGKPLLNCEVKRVYPEESSKTYYSLANYFPVQGKDGKLLGIGAVVIDITEKKTAQDELKKIAADLQQTNRALEEFGYVVSHDLKEPLRMVNSYLKLLSQRSEQWLDDECRDYVEFARRGACRMGTMVDELLRYSRLGGQPTILSAQPCSEIVDEVLENVRDRLEEVGAEVEVELLPAVAADRVQLTQVFQNLVANALKFRSDRPPQIEISAREFGGAYLFRVRDNGVGIDPSMLELIFDVFQRADRDGETPGDGIGLAVCRRIIELHGGKIWAESQPGQGSTFYFTLQRADLPA